VQEVLTLDVEDWLRQKLLDAVDVNDDEVMLPRGVWPDDIAPATSLVVLTDLRTQQPLMKVQLVLVPTTQSWQVPLLVGYGGYNACPYPEEHAAVLRRWEQQYGAKMAAMGPDYLELVVEQPPTTRGAAIALAAEQYAYCPDIVDQGTGTIEELAAALYQGSTWYFWWD
jgi:Domain of unknown function (DUF4253)